MRTLARPPAVRAVVLAMAPATDGSPAALLTLDGETLLHRVCRQLRAAAGPVDIRVVTRPEWVDAVGRDAGAAVATASSLPDTFASIADAADGDELVLANAEVVTHDSAVTALLRDPRGSAVMATSSRVVREHVAQVSVQQGRLVAADSAYHSASRLTYAFLGLLRLSGEDVRRSAVLASQLRELTRDQLPPRWEEELGRKVQRWGVEFFREYAPRAALAEELERESVPVKWLPDPADVRAEVDEDFRRMVLHEANVLAEDPLPLVLLALVRDGRPLGPSYLRGLFWARPLSQEAADEAAERLRDVDEDAVLLRAAVKSSDGFFTTFFVSPYSRYIARWCAHRGFTPNQVTVVSMLLGLAAAVAFAAGSREGLVAGALLLQVAFTADCVDGQLARYTRQFSGFGAWLDGVFDRGKEYAVYAGLALGAQRAGTSLWVLALAALALQTVRHQLDFAFGARQQQLLDELWHPPLAEPDGDAEPPPDHEPADGTAPALHAGPRLLTAAARASISASVVSSKQPWARWVKKILILPIGERFALISVTAALFGARATFVAVLTWGGIALVYATGGRLLRSAAA